MTSWRQERREVDRTERLELADLRDRAEGEAGLQILDVRERVEWDAGHIPGSTHLPYHDIHALPEGIDPERPVAVLCASGERAAVGASLVKRHGAAEVIHVTTGGVPKWERLGGPIERSSTGRSAASA